MVNWYKLVRESKLAPFRTFAKAIRKYRRLIENYILSRGCLFSMSDCLGAKSIASMIPRGRTLYRCKSPTVDFYTVNLVEKRNEQGKRRITWRHIFTRVGSTRFGAAAYVDVGQIFYDSGESAGGGGSSVLTTALLKYNYYPRNQVQLTSNLYGETPQFRVGDNSQNEDEIAECTPVVKK